jgi:hypothetical protein
MDRVTDYTYKIHATLPEVIVDDTPDDSNKNSNPGMSVMMMSGIMSLALILCFSLLLVLNIILRRKKQFAEAYDSYDSYSNSLLSPQVEKDPKPLAPPPPMIAELPPSGLPDGWTMEQWHYYGEEYLSRLQ